MKYEADLLANRATAFVPARASARERQAAFQVVTEREIREVRLQNAKRLMPLKSAAIDTQTAALALQAARSIESPTFGKVLATLPQSRPIALATIWRLIARGEPRADLSTHITPRMPCAFTAATFHQERFFFASELHTLWVQFPPRGPNTCKSFNDPLAGGALEVKFRGFMDLSGLGRLTWRELVGRWTSCSAWFGVSWRRPSGSNS